MTNEKAIELLEDVKNDYLQRGSSSYDFTSAEAVEYAMDAINKNVEMENKLACLKEELQTLRLENKDYVKNASMLNNILNFQAGQIDAYRYSEKQIPKKPVKVTDSRIRYISEYACPTCGRNFTGSGVADYCYHCGQALDWRDEI